MKIRRTTLDDLSAILILYRSVAAIPCGLARLADEVHESWVNEFLTRSRANGLCLVAEAESGRIVGEIHAYSRGLHCFSQVLTGLTIAVAPEAQGRGLGRLLLETFMRDVVETRPDIRRVELISRCRTGKRSSSTSPSDSGSKASSQDGSWRRWQSRVGHSDGLDEELSSAGPCACPPRLNSLPCGSARSSLPHSSCPRSAPASARSSGSPARRGRVPCALRRGCPTC